MMPRLTGLAVAATVTAGLLAGTASAQTTLRMAHSFQLQHPHHLASVAMAEHVAECTGGAVTIDIYPANQLGNEAALNEQVRVGGIDLIQTGFQWAVNSYEPIGVPTLPFLFRDREHAIAFQRSEIMRELIDGFNEATGLHMLAAGYHGAFNISSRGQRIETLEDAAGMRIRAPDTPLFMAFPPAIGAVAVPIPFAELYLALQQGVAQGSLNPITNTYAQGFWEVQDYVALTEHLVDYVPIIASSRAWGRLDEAQQACLQEGADIFAEESAVRNFELENELHVRMEAEGMVEITRPDKDAFVEATEELRQQLMAQFGWSEEIVERIRAIE